MNEGAIQYQKLLDAGFPRADADQWRLRETSRLQGAGFGQNDIDDYWGDGEKETPALDSQVAGNIQHLWKPEDAKAAKGPLDYLAAGWDMSSTALGIQGPPKTILPEHAGFMANTLYGLGQFAGDIPATIAGFLGGAVVGGTAGAAATAETGPGAAVGAAVGGTVGGFAGSAALPEAMRQVLMDHYRNGDFLTFNDFVSRSAAMSWETAKAGLVGGVAGPVGGVAGGKILGATGSKILAKTGEAATFAATATAVGGALNGRVPDAEDFGTAAAVMLGAHVAFSVVGATKRAVMTPRGAEVAENMRNIYIKTGMTPWEQAQRASTDPRVRQEILSQNADGKPITPILDAQKPAEPEPFKPPETPKEGKAIPEAEAASSENQLAVVRQLEGSADNAISPAGAVGRYQIMPNTARQYGFDPARLTDPEYNREVAQTILRDLSQRFRKPDGSVDEEAVLIAYNAGPGRAIQFRTNGRQFNQLPVETQRYLEHAERLGAFEKPTEIALAEPPAGGGKEPPPPGGAPPGEPGEPPRIEGPSPEADPFELNSKMLADKINSITAEPVKESLVNRTKDLLDRAYFESITELAPFKRLDKDMNLPADEVGLEDMFRSTYASSGRAYHFIHYGTLSPLEITEAGAESFKKLSDESLFKGYGLAKDAGVSIDEFVAYRRAKRTIELSKRGIETPTELRDAEAMVAKLDGKLKQAAEMVDRVNDAKINYMRDSGLLSAEQAKAIKDNNRYWIPYNPAKEGGYRRTGTRFGPTVPIKKIKGGKYQTVDPVVQELQSFHNAVTNADKNRATVSLMKTLSGDIKEKLGLREITDQQTKPELFDKYGNPIPEVVKEAGPLNADQFAYFEDGVRHVMRVDDPILARAIRGASSTDAGTLTKALRFFAQIKRSGIVEMPDYMARAMAKDVIGAKVLERWGGASLAQIWEAGMDVLHTTDRFKDYVAKGGLGTALTEMDAKYVENDLYRIFEETGTWDHVINTFRHPLQAAGVLMRRMDAILRLAETEKQKAAGIDPFKATMRARKINLDFAERGADTIVNWFASITPFLRPNMLGMDQLVRAIRTEPLSVLTKGVAYISTPIALLYAMNYMQDKANPDLPEDQKWANLPRWQKDTMFVLPRVGGVRLRVPMPPIIGPVFGGLTNRVLDNFMQDDPKAFDDWATSMWAQFIPPIIPAFGLPLYEHFANQNTMSGRPLIPASLEDASGYMQYVDYTSESAKKMAQWLGPPGVNMVDVSPIIIDNYVREWTGPMGQQMLRIVDAIMFPKTTKPWEFADVPVVGSFAVRNPGLSAQPIQDFYDELADVRRNNRDLALALERQNFEEIDWTSANTLAFVKLNSTAQALSNQRSVIDSINSSTDMTVDDKRQLIETIYTQMIAESRVGLDVVQALKTVH